MLNIGLIEDRDFGEELLRKREAYKIKSESL